jgi:alpha-L-fucosidase
MRILLLNFMLNSMVSMKRFTLFVFDLLPSTLPDPNEWADIFAASGAKYVQIITL